MLKEMMPVDEAIAWVEKWRKKHFAKVLGVKDKALITLAAAQKRVQSDVCPACFGNCERLYNDGLMHKCQVCNGTGTRR